MRVVRARLPRGCGWACGHGRAQHTLAALAIWQALPALVARPGGAVPVNVSRRRYGDIAAIAAMLQDGAAAPAPRSVAPAAAAPTWLCHDRPPGAERPGIVENRWVCWRASTRGPPIYRTCSRFWVRLYSYDESCPCRHAMSSRQCLGTVSTWLDLSICRAMRTDKQERRDFPVAGYSFSLSDRGARFERSFQYKSRVAELIEIGT